jgi:hypothetical protein
MLLKEEIISLVMDRFKGLVVNQNWGETGLFYNPEKKLKKGIYLLTFKEKDGEHDRASHLNRDGNFYRLNLGVSKKTFIQLFGSIPPRPTAGHVVEMDVDFTSVNTLMPHPIYSWMAWVCVINPTSETLNKLWPLTEEGYQLCVKKYERKMGTIGSSLHSGLKRDELSFVDQLKGINQLKSKVMTKQCTYTVTS